MRVRSGRHLLSRSSASATTTWGRLTAAALVLAGGVAVVGSSGASAAAPVTNWPDLVSAFAAGGTVVLGADITQPSGSLPVGGLAVTLDLNGHTLSVTSEQALAAVSVPVGTKLTVVDPVGGGTLKADSQNGAGIGGDSGYDSGAITIAGGTVQATSTYGSAGIGGGSVGRNGRIEISGGSVTATAGPAGAGIGGGLFPVDAADIPTGVIVISGGTVVANGGPNGAGIGGGQVTRNGPISITGGTVTATGGLAAAGIGSGLRMPEATAPGGSIEIHAGTVTANGGVFGAGIGGGYRGPTGPVTILGGTVTANGASTAAGIGAGEGTAGNAVSIASPATVTTRGGNAIGAYNNTATGTFTNNGTLNIPAGQKLTIPAGATADNGGTINLLGTLDGAGTLVNSGRIVGTAATGVVSGAGQGNGNLLVSRHNYRLQFNLNAGPGATPGDLSAYTTTFTDAGLTLPTPTAAPGYTFTGWYTSPGAGSQITTLTQFTGNGPTTTTVYAHYIITQAITFTSTIPSSPAVGDSYQIAATGGGSGNPVTYTSTTTGVCTVTGSTVSFNHPGACSVRANQAAGGFYTDAPAQTQSTTVVKADQTLTFTSTVPAAPVVGGSYQVAATGGLSGNPVTFDTSTSAVCSVSGATVTFLHTGNCVVAAHQAGTSDYNAAPARSQNIGVGKASQTVAFTSTAPTGPVVGGTYQVAAASSVGLPVAFTSATTAVCTVAGSTVTFLHAGPCTVQADQVGNSDYTAAVTQTQNITVGAAAQSISFTSTAPTAAVVGGTYTVSASGGASGKPVVFTSATTAVCTLAGSTVTFLRAGSCSINADQAGNGDYTAAPTQAQNIGVGKAAQTISFTSTAPAAAVVDGSYQVAATGGASGKPVTFSSGSLQVCTVSGTTVTFNHVGDCLINADQAGSDDYTAASTTVQSVLVGKAAQAISITSPLPDAPVVGDVLELAATGGASGNVVTFSTSTTDICTVTGATVTFDHIGDCAIDADQVGNTDYTEAPTATRTVTVGQAPQVISFTSTEPDAAVVGDTYEVAAVGGSLRSNPLGRSLPADGSGEPVTFSTSTTDVCTVTGTTVTFDHVGDCLINADQAGNDDYTAAETKSQTVSVGPAPQTISFTSTEPEAPVVGQVYTVSATGGPSGNEVTFTTPSTAVCSVTGTTVTFNHVGDCIINADQDGNDDHTAAPTAGQTVTVGRAPQTVEFTSTPPSDPRAGDTYEPVATGGDSGNPLVFTIDPASTAGACAIKAGKVLFTGPGACIIIAQQAGDADHLPTTTQQIVTVAAGKVTIATEVLPDGTVGSDYTAAVQAEGGLAPYTWAVTDGALPDGLALDPDSGKITGTPRDSGTSSFTIGAVDTENPPVTGTRAFTITIGREDVLPPVVDPTTGSTPTPVPTTGSTASVPPSTTVPAPPGTTTPPPTALPATGVNTVPLIILGMVLLLAGFVVDTRIGRARRQH